MKLELREDLESCWAEGCEKVGDIVLGFDAHDFFYEGSVALCDLHWILYCDELEDEWLAAQGNSPSAPQEQA